MASTGPITTQDEFERFVVDTLRENPFLATVSRYIRKLPNDKMPTAGVSYNAKTEDISMGYNLEYFSGLTREEAKGVFHHELYHVIWDHLSGRFRTPPQWWNIATDLCINSTIVNENNGKLPNGLFMPGVRPNALDKDGKIAATRAKKNDDGSITVERYKRDPTPEEKKLADTFGDLIEKMPHAKASEWYFDRVAEWAEENGGGEGDSDAFNSFDDHGGWSEIPDGMRDLVSGKVRSIVSKAVQDADSQSDGWGNIPQELREEIRRFVSKSVDWRRVLRYFVGTLCRGHRTTTFKRINKRYPYQHPGSKRGYRAKVAIFIDQSGSVSDDNVMKIFAALNTLSKIVEFQVYHFDTEVDVKNSFTWKKNQIPKHLRTRCGGTDFQAVTDFVNNPKNLGKFDGYLICTDGECEKPGPSRLKRAWIIVPDHKLPFEVDEMVVNMSDSPEHAGR